MPSHQWTAPPPELPAELASTPGTQTGRPPPSPEKPPSPTPQQADAPSTVSGSPLEPTSSRCLNRCAIDGSIQHTPADALPPAAPSLAAGFQHDMHPEAAA